MPVASGDQQRHERKMIKSNSTHLQVNESDVDMRASQGVIKSERLLKIGQSVQVFAHFAVQDPAMQDCLRESGRFAKTLGKSIHNTSRN